MHVMEPGYLDLHPASTTFWLCDLLANLTNLSEPVSLSAK